MSRIVKLFQTTDQDELRIDSDGDLTFNGDVAVCADDLSAFVLWLLEEAKQPRT